MIYAHVFVEALGALLLPPAVFVAVVRIAERRR